MAVSGKGQTLEVAYTPSVVQIQAPHTASYFAHSFPSDWQYKFSRSLPRDSEGTSIKDNRCGQESRRWVAVHA